MMKKILVTGANRGIGQEIAKQLLRKGHEVIITARDVEKGQKALSELKNLGAS